MRCLKFAGVGERTNLICYIHVIAFIYNGFSLRFMAQRKN